MELRLLIEAGHYQCDRCTDIFDTRMGENGVLVCENCGYRLCAPCQSHRAHSCLSDNR